MLIYSGHLFFGALVSDVSLLMGIAAALLVGFVVATPWLRDEVVRLKGLTLPTVCFALVIAAALWALTPWGPNGPHPVWGYVGLRSGSITIDRSATLIETIKLLGLGCVFVLGLAVGARDDRARYAIGATLAAGMIFSLWAFVDGVYNTPVRGPRIEAHFLNANTAGTLFAILLMLSLTRLASALRSQSKSFSRTAYVGAGILTFLVCLIATASRGAVTAAAVGLAVFFTCLALKGQIRWSQATAGLGASAVSVVVLLLIFGGRLLDRMASSHGVIAGRPEIWKPHWDAFLASPLFGYGLGSAETVNKSISNIGNYDVLWNVRAIMNVYLQWLEEAGLVGALPMFACVGVLILVTGRGMWSRSRMTTSLAGLLAVDAVILVHGLSDFALEVPSMAAQWAWLLGLQVSLAQGRSTR